MKKPSWHRDLEEQRTVTASFRHDILAPLIEIVERREGPGVLLRAMRVISKQKLTFPSGEVGTISVSSLRRWLTAYLHGGLETLKPALRSDYGKSRAIPIEWVNLAIALRAELPSRTATMLIEILKRQKGYPTAGINAHTLDKVLRRLGHTRHQDRHRYKKKPARRWSAKHVNDLWQGDATPGVWLPHPRHQDKKILTKLFLWIDDKSRLVVYAEFFYDEKLPRMERTLKLALLRRGKPKRLYTDNGSVFVASQFKAAMDELRIKRIRSRPRQPRGRGKVERMLQTVQEGFYPEVYKAGITTLQELNESLWAWLECVYHERAHSETHQKPIEAYRSEVERVSQADPVKVARAFLWRFTRKVSDAGFISLLGNSYSVDPVWAGNRIELRCDPFDLSRMEVYRDCRPIGTATVRLLKKGSCLDLVPTTPPSPAPAPTGINFLDALRDEHRRHLAAEIGEIPFRTALAPASQEELEVQP
jgi:putative transposase